MKYTKFLILILGLVIFQSCNKESNDKVDRGEEIELREGDLKEHRECFELVFPLEVVLPDRSTLEIESQEDMQRKMRRWYNAHSDVKERPGLKYPVEVSFGGDKTKTISSEEDMMALKKYCGKKEGRKCFEVIYPMTYVMPDGTEITGDTERELNSEMKQWYVDNPDSKEKPEVSYPVDIKTKDGETISIQNEEEMIKLKKRCEDK